MLDLSLYPKIEQDIQSRVPSIIPLIIINPENNPIYISTSRGLFDENIFFEDYNLKISSIKDRIDLKKDNFAISSVFINLSNFSKKEGLLSDLIYNQGLFNKLVEIYYMTPSCSKLTDCMLIYKGKLKEAKHDNEKINIILEDFTEDKLTKVVPIANMGHSSNLYSDTYKDSPIPIIYGEVDKAPAIPWIDRLNSSDENNIKILCDDLLNLDRGININGFGANEFSEFTSPLIEDAINPLYIFKNDYFQVLENFQDSVLEGGEGDTADWSWQDNEQYKYNNSNVIEINKKFFGIIAQNPPAMNELQCVKVRFPNQCLIMPNPEGDTIEDDFGVAIFNQQSTIKSPLYAIDNPIDLPTTSRINQDFNFGDSYFDSRAQVPNNEVFIEQEDSLIITDFRIHQNTSGCHGIWLPKNGKSTFQHKMFEWLNINMHNFNDELENPTVVYKQIPTIVDIMNKLNYKLAIYSGLITEDVTWSDFLVNYDINYLSFEDASCDSYHRSFYSDYKNDYHTNQGEKNYYFDNSIRRQSHSDNQQWWYDLQDNSPVPQPFLLRFKIKNQYRKAFEEGGVNCDNVFISMDNNSFDTNAIHKYVDIGENQVGHSKYYDLFDIGEHEGLFNPDGFAEYSPFELNQRRYIKQNHQKEYFTSYNCYWNGITPHNKHNGTTPFEGNYWGSYGYPQGDANINQSNMYISGESCWVIWVKNANINNVGFDFGENEDVHPFVDGDDNHTAHGETTLIMHKNTMFPTIHKSKHSNSDGWSIVKQDFNGLFLSTYLNNFAISDYDENTASSDKRLNILFPFKDLNIVDEIKSDTFFHGKIKCFFNDTDTYIGDNSTANFVLNIGSVDSETTDENGNVVIDFESMDGGEYTDGTDANGNQINSKIINQRLSDCVATGEQWYSSDPIDEQEDLNNYEGLVRVNQFWETNDFNSLCLTYRIHNNNYGNSEANSTHGAEGVLNTDIHSVGLVHFVQFEAAFDSEIYVNAKGRVNTNEDIVSDNDNNLKYKYTNELFEENSSSFIEKPTDIIYHFIEKEIELMDVVNKDSINKARLNVHNNHKYAFSLKEEQEAKSFLSDFSQNTQLMPKFARGNSLEFAYIKNTYSDGDVDFQIKSKDVISYNFDRTPISDINTIVNVKYKIDYAKDEYTKETGYVDGYDMFGNGDGTDITAGRENGYSYEYLGLEREDRVLEFESDYIRDENTAKSLRDFLFMKNCNQHNIFSISLPVKYLMLESGDIINFDNLLDGVKAYGEDYTKTTLRNGQTIYPYFIITNVNRKSNVIEIKCQQLHSLNKTFNAALSSITRLVDESEIPSPTMEDYYLLDSYLNEGENYFTREQKRVSDISNGIADGFIDEHDLSWLIELMQMELGQADVNLDGLVNVVDIIPLINAITSEENLSVEQLAFMDVNQDGVVNVSDIMQIISTITENNDV